MLAVLVTLVQFAIGLRFSFLLPEIALHTFSSIGATWKRTHSNALRILAVIFLADLPLYFSLSLLRGVERSVRVTSAVLVVMSVTERLLLFVSLAVVTGAVAVSYRIRMDLNPNSDQQIIAASPSL